MASASEVEASEVECLVDELERGDVSMRTKVVTSRGGWPVEHVT
ncbi:hypothetical protein ACNOYE_20905 [Nannocystaceae bacterium ST9]